MAQSQGKTWKKSKNKRTYVKVAFLFLTTPRRVYEIAHMTSSSTMREKAIRAKLVELGVLRFENPQQVDSNIDLNNGHI